MRSRLHLGMLLFLVMATSLHAQPQLSMGTYQAAPGTRVLIPITFTPAAGALLSPTYGVDRTPQAFAIKIDVSPSGAVTSIKLRRAGTAALRAVSWERSLTGPASATLLMQFNEKTNSAALSNGGDVVCEAVLDVRPEATGTITVSFDRDRTEIANQSGTMSLADREKTLTLNDGMVTLVAGVSAQTRTSAVATAATPQPSIPPSKIAPGVAAEIARNGSADVIVQLIDPVPVSAPSSARQQAVHDIQAAILGHLNVGAKQLRYAYSHVPALALNINAELLDRLAAEPAVQVIAFDGRIEFSLCDSVSLLQANLAHSGAPGRLPRNGGPGTGQTRPHRIALIDTGYTADFGPIDGQIFAEVATATIMPPPCYPRNGCTDHPAFDLYRHGTWVAEVVGATGTCPTNPSITSEGFAPGADLISIKIDASKIGQPQLSDFVAALNWIHQYQAELAVDIVNMSFNFVQSNGSPYAFSTRDDCDRDPALQTVKSAVTLLHQTDHIIFFQASGNHGDKTRVTAPGCFTDRVWNASTQTFSAGMPSVMSVSGTFDKLGYATPQPMYDLNNYYIPNACQPGSRTWTWYCQMGYEFPDKQDDGLPDPNYPPFSRATPQPGQITIFANAAPPQNNANGKFDMVDMVAPATFINLPDPSYSTLAPSGTSFSAPMAAGIAALIEQARPQLTVPCEVEQIMKSPADTVTTAFDPLIAPGTPGGTNTFPQLNALNLVIATDPAFTTRGDADGDGALQSADIDYLVNYLFANGPRPRFIRANANHDCSVSPADIFFLIYHLDNGGPGPTL